MKKDKKGSQNLNESVVRGWGKIAGIEEIQASFINERYYQRDMDEPGALEEELDMDSDDELDMGSDELDMDSDDELDMGSDDLSIGDEFDAGDEEMPEDSGTVDLEEDDVAKIVDAVAQAIEQITNVDVDVETDSDDELGADPADEGDSLDMASEEELDMDSEEEVALQEKKDDKEDDKKELDEMTDALTEMVYRKIMKKLKEVKTAKASVSQVKKTKGKK